MSAPRLGFLNLFAQSLETPRSGCAAQAASPARGPFRGMAVSAVNVGADFCLPPRLFESVCAVAQSASFGPCRASGKPCQGPLQGYGSIRRKARPAKRGQAAPSPRLFESVCAVAQSASFGRCRASGKPCQGPLQGYGSIRRKARPAKRGQAAPSPRLFESVCAVAQSASFGLCRSGGKPCRQAVFVVFLIFFLSAIF